MLAFYLFRISEIFNDCLNFLKNLGGWGGGWGYYPTSYFPNHSTGKCPQFTT